MPNYKAWCISVKSMIFTLSFTHHPAFQCNAVKMRSIIYDLHNVCNSFITLTWPFPLCPSLHIGNCMQGAYLLLSFVVTHSCSWDKVNFDLALRWFWSHCSPMSSGTFLFIPLGDFDMLLQVSALHYTAGSQVSEGFQTVASAHALCQPTIVCVF